MVNDVIDQLPLNMRLAVRGDEASRRDATGGGEARPSARWSAARSSMMMQAGGAGGLAGAAGLLKNVNARMKLAGSNASFTRSRSQGEVTQSPLAASGPPPSVPVGGGLGALVSALKKGGGADGTARSRGDSGETYTRDSIATLSHRG